MPSTAETQFYTLAAVSWDRPVAGHTPTHRARGDSFAPERQVTLRLAWLFIWFYSALGSLTKKLLSFFSPVAEEDLEETCEALMNWKYSLDNYSELASTEEGLWNKQCSLIPFILHMS